MALLVSTWMVRLLSMLPSAPLVLSLVVLLLRSHVRFPLMACAGTSTRRTNAPGASATVLMACVTLALVKWLAVRFALTIIMALLTTTASARRGK